MKKYLLYSSIVLSYLFSACTTTKAKFDNQTNVVIGGVNAQKIANPYFDIKRSFFSKTVVFSPIIGGIAYGVTEGAKIEIEDSKTGKKEAIGKTGGGFIGFLAGGLVSYLFSAAAPQDKVQRVDENNYDKWLDKNKNFANYYVGVLNAANSYQEITFFPKAGFAEFTASSSEEIDFYHSAYANQGEDGFVRRSLQKNSSITFLKHLLTVYPNTSHTKNIQSKIEEEESFNKIKYQPRIKEAIQFLNLYPKSKYKTEVEGTLTILSSTMEDCKLIGQSYPPFSEKTEDLAYKIAGKNKDFKQKYLDLFPNGKYKQQVKQEIISIEKEERRIALKQEQDRIKAEKEAEKKALSDAEAEKQQLAQEKIEREQDEFLQRQRNALIVANSNATKWAKGDKICSEVNDGILMGTIDDWNEGHSKARIKIVAGPAGLYEGEPILQGEYLWVSAKGKGWHICLDDEINTATQTNKAHKQVQQGNTKQNETQKVDTRAVARYVKSFGNFLQYKCNSGGATLSKPNIQINKTTLENGKYLVDVTVNWVEGTGSLLGDVLGGRSSKKFSGVLMMDEYGCNAIMAIRQSNEFSFFGFSCLSNMPEKDIDREHPDNPFYNCTKYIGAGCLDE